MDNNTCYVVYSIGLVFTLDFELELFTCSEIIFWS